MSIHLIKEISRLKKKILQLCAMVEESVREAVESVAKKDAALAALVEEKDERIDQMEIELEEECLKTLALYQPVANDLRYVVACLKMNTDLERIADLAVNIARRAESLSHYEGEAFTVDFYPMMSRTQKMLKKTIDSFVESDLEKAYEVLAQDDEIDDMNRQMHQQINSLIRRDPDKAEFYIYFLSVSKHLERIGDCATNIAEDVIYLINGKIVRHQYRRHSADGRK